MKRCPECSLLAPRGRWSCACGFEFSGDEPEATPTPDEMRSIAANERWLCALGFEFSEDEPEATPTPDEMRSIAASESRQLSASRGGPSVSIAVILLSVGIICLTGLNAIGNGVIVFGLLTLGSSFVLFALRLFRAAQMRPLAICCGLVLVLLGAACFGLSLIAQACSMGK